ncbi:MAG TPA: BON domain-containing protein [Chloroflexota bacterium]|nr:BON domain-containing protein [Chloroflexota bacterium]
MEPSDERFRPGDFFLSADDLPVGRLESALNAASGVRLLIARAYAPRAYVYTRHTDVRRSTDDPVTALRWHELEISAEELLRRGTFLREMGRLSRDPFPSPPRTPPDHKAAAAEVGRALDEDPLTTGSEIAAMVQHGVAVLDGWLDTVGGKVAADRLARTTPGIWDAVNRLYSDEELNAAVRTYLRSRVELAPAIQDVKVTSGRVTITVIRDASMLEQAAQHIRVAVPGIRAITVEAAPG